MEIYANNAYVQNVSQQLEYNTVAWFLNNHLLYIVLRDSVALNLS